MTVAPLALTRFMTPWMAEVVAVGLHGQAVDAHSYGPLLLSVPDAVSGVVPGLFQHPIRDEVFAGTVAFHDCLDEVLWHLVVVGQ